MSEEKKNENKPAEEMNKTETKEKPKKKKLSINAMISSLLVCALLLFGLSIYAFMNREQIDKNLRDAATTPTSFKETTTTDKTLPSELTTPSSKLVLVDSVHTLPVDYVPSTLKDDIYLKSTSEVIPIDEETGNKAKEMMQAANDAGISLYVVTGYRSYEDQQKYYTSRMELLNNSEDAKKQVQAAGCSEHQTGLAIDFTDDPSNAQPTTDFGKTDAGKWLYEHAHEYGFILRYPEGKEDITGYTYEPWHFRYINIEIATYLKENNLTYEEYYGMNLNK